MQTFIRVAEVWVPSADGSVLELAEGMYDAAPSFGAQSRRMCFGRAEGLPGQAWDEGRPVLLEHLEGPAFRRTAAARAAHLTSALALPVFLDRRLTSVVVLFCGDGEGDAGALELWRNDPRVTTDLTLAGGWFGAAAVTSPTTLAVDSRDTYLPRGSGLPGLAWQRESAVFIDNLGSSPHFVRAQTAAAAGVVRGLALPCATRTRETWILSLLSSVRTPVARRVESWLPGPGGQAGSGALQRGFGHCESAGALAGDGSGLRPAAALGAIGLAWSSGAAQLAAGAHAAGDAFAAERAAHGLSTLLAIPVVSDGAVSEVVALSF